MRKVDSIQIEIGSKESSKKLRSDLFSTKSAKITCVMMLLEAGLSDDEICGITGNSLKTLAYYKRMRPEHNLRTIERLHTYLRELG